MESKTTTQTSTKLYIYTAQMATHHAAKRAGVFFLDITAMSGNPHFAPDWRVLRAYKDGKVSNGLYTDLYEVKMYESIESHPESWKALREHPTLIAACYCAAGKYCHRHPFVDVYQRYLSWEGIELINLGEFTKDTIILKEPDGTD